MEFLCIIIRIVEFWFLTFFTWKLTIYRIYGITYENYSYAPFPNDSIIIYINIILVLADTLFLPPLLEYQKKKKKKDPNFLSIVQPSNPFEFSPLIDQQSKKFIEERRAREEGREQHMPDRQWDRLVIRRRDEQQSSPLGPVNRDKRVHPDPIDLSQVPSGMGAD